ncbi:TetR family transcriptional regulator [Bifidobacterium eulemuris]|uniref:Transcriptional regulator n=1 Tax=Bifidobacterium eulemuris TaxID=1765219 RepID=A0A261GC92_9BIFI|nr:TetR family transcriptional regulator [Bifidobacterium eulemuris]OZG69061.1 transcriptional regulator [Bifidobacterium eulemuris]QOL31413.1 TetR family transcriptional regulator [Bifidobacterium eulemuris]
MTFQRARTKEQTDSRREEILNACAKLCGSMEFDEITLKAISAETSVSRTTLYGYYKTKDEILLDLLKREYLLWNQRLEEAFASDECMGAEGFSRTIAASLVDRELFMRLLSVQTTTIERNCSVEQLAKFNTEVQVAMETLAKGIDKAFEAADEKAKERFLVELLVYLLGLYPYTHPTQKQLEAARLSGLAHPRSDINTLCLEGVAHLCATVS